MNKRVSLGCTALGASLTFYCGSVLAQATPPETTRGVGSLEEIVVTAQKRSENLQVVPLAVSAVTSEQLASSGVGGTADLKVAIPSVNVAVSNGYVVPFIRGLGSRATGPGTESSVSIYVDNVYIGAQSGGLLNFNNVERVEVLKGPQGTLFGRNATGGLISIVTRDPTEAFSGDSHVSYGDYDTVNGDLYLAGGVAPNVRASVAAYGRRQGEGYGTNFFNGEDVYKVNHDYGVQTKWVFDLPADWELRLAADYTNLRSSMNAQRLALGKTLPPPLGPNYGGSAWDTMLSVQPNLETVAKGASIRLNGPLFGNFADFQSITAFRRTHYQNHFDIDLSAVEGRSIFINQPDEQFSQEFQVLSGTSSPFQWVGGLFYYHSDGKFDPTQVTLNGVTRPGAFQHSATYGRQKVESVAPYVQSTFDVFADTHLTLGARWTYEKREQDGEQKLIAPTGAQLGNSAFIEQSLTAKKPTWRVALDHQFTPDVMAYVSYNRGFKSGGANASSVTAKMYLPESLDAYEVGAKTMFLDRRMRLNGAVFYYEYKDIQVQRIVEGTLSIFNGAKARTYGAELELEAQVTDAFRLTSSVTLLDTEFEDFPDAVINLPNPEGGYRQIFGSVKGNNLPMAPDAVFNLAGTYTINVGDNKLILNGGYYHNTGYFGEPDNVAEQDAFDLINASIEYRFAQDRYSVALWGKNLADEDISTYPSSIATGGNSVFGGSRSVVRDNYEPPRTYGITFGVTF